MRQTSVLILLVLALLESAGCTSRTLLTEADRQPGRIHRRCLVYLRGGEQIPFERASFVADSLVGEIKLQVERHEGDNYYYEDVLRRHPIPLSEIDSIAVVRTDLGKTVLLGAGVAAAVIFLRSVASTDNSGGRNSGDRPPPPNPLSSSR